MLVRDDYLLSEDFAFGVNSVERDRRHVAGVVLVCFGIRVEKRIEQVSAGAYMMNFSPFMYAGLGEIVRIINCICLRLGAAY